MYNRLLRSIKSRAGQYGVVCVAVSQFNQIDKRVTAYSMAKVLDCSVPTARKILNELVSIGDLEAQTTDFKNTKRTEYKVTDQWRSEVTEDFCKAASSYMMSYHIGGKK